MHSHKFSDDGSFSKRVNSKLSLRRGLTFLACAVATAGIAPAVTANAAAKSMQPLTYQTQITVAAKLGSRPYAFTFDNTTYMPIWYVMQMLNKVGVGSGWDGHNWRLTTPDKVKPNLSSIHAGAGNAHIYLNGTLVWSLHSIVAIDPGSHKAATFMPIWNVMQTLNRVGIPSTWKNKVWNMSLPAWVVPPPSTGSASGSNGGAGTGTGTASGTGPTPPTVLPQPALPANEVTRAEFEKQLLGVLGIAPDATGTSPYDDIAANDPNWGCVHAAIEHNLLVTDSPSHSGAYEAITLQTADQTYWNYLGITDSAFQPGLDPVTWAGIVQLNPPGLSASTALSAEDLTVFMQNLSHLVQGYAPTPTGGYRIDYPAADEAAATFAGDNWNGQPFYTSNTDVQTAIIEVYHFFDQINVAQAGTNLVLTVPNLLGTNWFFYAGTTGDIQYSVDGGSTWQTTPVLDTRNLAGSTAALSSSTILVRVPADNGLTLSINQLMPQFAGSLVLGELQMNLQQGVLNVQRINLSGP
ncbi:MAG: hypothetical protein A2201_00630 [Alicyclobacillus sp. RIFOXYA1_FULL_53_8]|nr:MAG: hypothetical protein A2201_00630 [Alicyclobacillus sp. RIFOXYA1_FULL_53_8]